MAKILLLEDDIDLGNMLKRYLQTCDFEISLAVNGEEGLIAIEQNHFDLCICDVMMPKMDGFEFAKILKEKQPNTPFLFLTARGLKEDKIKGLKLGADDYITKPFDVDELELRIHNILKRSHQISADQTEIPHDSLIGKYHFDQKNLSLKRGDTSHRLTEKETLLLAFFNQHRNQLIKKNDILDQFWEENDFFTRRSLDVFISRLRKYLKEDDKIEIETIRGVGLIFKVEEN